MTRTAIFPAVVVVVFVTLTASLSVAEDKMPSAHDLEAMGAVIGEISYDKRNVFDTTQPGENKSLFRLANRWHIVTRDSVIQHQLLFSPGDKFSNRLIAESERLLRQNAYLHDAKIEPTKYANGVVDIRIQTRELWTLSPGFSVSRSGGENSIWASLSERNLLGSGASLRLSYVDNVDRKSTSFQYYDKNLGRTWTSMFLDLTDSSDGHSTDVRVIRPFYALDSRRSGGTTFYDNSREVSYYELGDRTAEYAVDSNSYSAFIGWSGGLQDGWVRRWTAGFVHDSRTFTDVANGTLPSLLPADRNLVYPYIGFELLEDKFESTSNRDQIARTEDFYLGTRLWTSIGFASEHFGSDRESVVYRIEASKGFGSIKKDALLLSSSFSGRIDDGRSVNSNISFNARYYRQTREKHLFFMTLDGSHGSDLDLDNFVDLGGDTGLRGYPLRYQSGDSKLLFTIEQRYFTDWYPFKLFRVGGAVFADIGRTWGDSPLGTPSVGWLKDVGFGLRFVPTRASGREVMHLDIAFPLDGGTSIDEVQILLESKRSF